MTAALLLLAGAASAQPLVGHDGKIHACYRVKGKPRGALRVVKSPRPHCLRGERRVAWIVGGVGLAGEPGEAGAQGARGSDGAPGEKGTPGANGAAGADGAPGADGADGSSPSLSALEAQVAALSTKVASLEGILAGVTNAQLLEAVALPPVVDALCTQTTTLTTNLNAVLAVLVVLGLPPIDPVDCTIP